MRVELKGGTINKLFYDPATNRVEKLFGEGNGIGRPLFDRVIAEVRSMHSIPLAPKLFDYRQDFLTMSYIAGENHLNQNVDSYPEPVRNQIYFQAGQNLRTIHKTQSSPLPPPYHEQHRRSIYALLARTSESLTGQGISVVNLLSYLEKSYTRALRKIEAQGFVWSHGDYWLANVIGREKNGRFTTAGIVDWELAGLTTPYEDFAVVRLSIENDHPESSGPFWKGYGAKPNPELLNHYAFLKILEWMSFDPPATNGNYSSHFYQKKFALIKASL